CMHQKRSFVPPPRQRLPLPEAPPSLLEVWRQRLVHFYRRFQVVLLLAAGAAVAIASMLAYEATKPPPQRLTQRDFDAAVARVLEAMPPKPSWTSLAYEVIRPSVVRIIASGAGAERGRATATGSGVVIDEDGTILTALHVVRGATAIRVVFADGTESEASLIASQPESDLAALRPRVLPDDLMPATLTDSSTLKVGDEVAAVGHPFGISNSLSAGVVSGLGRNFKSPRTGQVLSNLIQFDAAVNPGNSGGPLINRAGEVVGIVTALYNPTDDDFFIGIGFAIPIETATAGLGSPPH
ncbi:MAG: trypsin-like peptidase domain-containing protein, partial [Dehalococcoidia bacterium]|nr:trypsin-like peptidase domain-containing protein [Dehalococcoidia bacterium]